LAGLAAFAPELTLARRRVVVTGLGIVSPVGNSVDEAWANIVAGRSGIGPITKFDASTMSSRIAGEVKDPQKRLPRIYIGGTLAVIAIYLLVNAAYDPVKMVKTGEAFYVSLGLAPLPETAAELTARTWAIRRALEREGVRGAGGAEIDHIELFGPPQAADAQSRNFVLCPGDAYDRSPCGTGTSAKLACLAADGKLSEGQVWRQQSVIGSVFEGSFQIQEGKVIPTISGEAWVMTEGHLLVDERDPFGAGISG